VYKNKSISTLLHRQKNKMSFVYDPESVPELLTLIPHQSHYDDYRNRMFEEQVQFFINSQASMQRTNQASNYFSHLISNFSSPHFSIGQASNHLHNGNHPANSQFFHGLNTRSFNSANPTTVNYNASTSRGDSLQRSNTSQANFIKSLMRERDELVSELNHLKSQFEMAKRRVVDLESQVQQQEQAIQRFESSQTTFVCPVCLNSDPPNTKTIALQCGHAFCSECYHRFKSHDSCPTWRKPGINSYIELYF
jgi:hypothetical protein